MDIRQMEIPRVGQKYTLTTSKGSKAILIFHRSGKREFYFLQETDEEPELALELSDEEARVIGALLLGIDYHAEPGSSEESQDYHDNIIVEWVPLSEASDLANKSIAEAEDRSKTGVTIIGIERKGEVIGSPEINDKMLPGDQLMVTGEADDIKEFEKICQGERKC